MTGGYLYDLGILISSMVISGTDWLEVPIPYIRPIYIYISGLNFREYPHNSYRQKYGTFTYLHQLDPEDLPVISRDPRPSRGNFPGNSRCVRTWRIVVESAFTPWTPPASCGVAPDKPSAVGWFQWTNPLTGWWWLEHFIDFPFHIYGIILPIDVHIFQRGRSTTNQLKKMIVIPFVIGYCRLVHPSYVSVWTLLIPLTREIRSTITLENHGMSSWDMNAFTKFIYQTLKTLGCPLTNGTLDRKINYRMGPRQRAFWRSVDIWISGWMNYGLW